MSDDTTTEAHEPTEPTGAPADDQPQSENKAGKEAARYRRQLRATESERDQLRDQLTALRRAAVEDRLAAQHVPAAGFWASGVTLEDLLDASGDIDDEKVKAAADAAVAGLGLERAGVHMKPVPSEGRVTRPSATPSWEAAFGPK